MKRTHDQALSSELSQTRSKRSKNNRDAALDTVRGVNPDIARMSSDLLVDHIAQKTKRFRPDLSLVESDDLRVPITAVQDTTAFTETRVADKLADFIEHFAGSDKKAVQKLSTSSAANGTPHTLIVAAAGLRAADLTRSIRKFQSKDSMVAKLFAKHIKLKEASAMASKTRMGIGVGTPQRIGDLISDGALKLDCLERIVVDASHIDQKKRGILDIKELQMPLIGLLTRPEIKECYESDSPRLQLLFF